MIEIQSEKERHIVEVGVNYGNRQASLLNHEDRQVSVLKIKS